MLVSILVLVESPLQLDARDAQMAAQGGFNPCFSGISSSICLQDPSEPVAGVSILVLVESPLQFYDAYKAGEYEKSFNPCFSGISSSILRRVETETHHDGFQSLF